MSIRIDKNEIPDNIIEAKRWWREQIREVQKSLTSEYMEKASASIIGQLEALDEFRTAKNVLLYVSLGKEVQTAELMEAASTAGKTVALPLCMDTREHIMEARFYDEEHPLVKGAYGIMEPAADSMIMKPEEIDLIVLPCMSCDPDCNRIGHGAGYYDRFLAKVRDNCVTVALCYSAVLAEKLPTEEHDKKVDIVITESEVYRGAIAQR